MWPLGLVPYQDEGPPKLAVFDQFGPQNTHSWVLKTPGLPSKNPQGVEIIFGPLYNDFSVNLVDFKNVIHCLNNFRQMTRTGTTSGSRWGKGGGGVGRGGECPGGRGAEAAVVAGGLAALRLPALLNVR